MRALFNAHPASVGESYFQHMRQASSFAVMMAIGAFCCLVHAFLPFAFEKAGSRIISGLYDRMLKNRTKQLHLAPNQPDVTLEVDH